MYVFLLVRQVVLGKPEPVNAEDEQCRPRLRIALDAQISQLGHRANLVSRMRLLSMWIAQALDQEDVRHLRLRLARSHSSTCSGSDPELN